MELMLLKVYMQCTLREIASKSQWNVCRLLQSFSLFLSDLHL